MASGVMVELAVRLRMVEQIKAPGVIRTCSAQEISSGSTQNDTDSGLEESHTSA